MPVEEFSLADRPEHLERCLLWLDDLDVVGVDVERADWRRYWRAAALIQVGGGGRVALVDPLALDDLGPLDAFLKSRVAVFHAMENDLGPLAALGVTPGRIEDTGIAAALLGLPTGLEGLLRAVLAVELGGEKQTMQRADWEARPLQADMLSYAAGDVADLPDLWQRLQRRLVATGRDDWYRQELQAALSQPPAEQRRQWTRTRGAGRLDATARARLRALWDTREALARSTDTAPGRILGDQVMVDLATKPPRSAADLARRGVRRQAVRNYGRALLAALMAADERAPEHAGREGRLPTEADRTKVDRLRALRAQRARELGIDPGVLCPSRTLMAALLTDPATPGELRKALGLHPWQWQQLGALFCTAVGVDGAGATPTATAFQGERTMADVLNADALHHELDRLDGWGGTVEKIAKTYRFADFAEAMRFVDRVAGEAEEANHHPDIHISWNRVTLELVTHSAGGVTQNDIALARRIDGLGV